MTKEEFLNYEIKKVAEYMPKELEGKVSLQEETVVKMNDQVLKGIRFDMGKGVPNPAIYIDDAYENYEEGMDPDEIAKKILSSYEMSMQHIAPTIGSDKGQNTNSRDTVNAMIKSIGNPNLEEMNLGLRLLNVDLNRKFLEDKPYMLVTEKLALICDIKANLDEAGQLLTSVTNQLVQSLNLTKEEIFEKALDSAWENDPPVMQSIRERAFNIFGENLFESKEWPTKVKEIYVLKCQYGRYGAASIFYPKVKEIIYQILGEEYYVLPSSVEEVIIVPWSMRMPENYLRQMVRDVNEQVVDPGVILYDEIFKYNSQNNELELVRENDNFVVQ